jgi:hypothetical protein
VLLVGIRTTQTKQPASWPANAIANLEHVKSSQGRDRSRDIVGGDEGHDSDHGKSSIVQFTALLDFQCFGVNSGKVNRRENNGGHGSSLHVVSSLTFGGKFGNEDCSQDLCLAGIRNGVPGIERLHGGERFEGDVVAEHAREVESGSLHDVTCCGKHGNSSVLQFGGAEPVEGLITSNIGKSKRIESLDRGGVSWKTAKVGVQLGAGSLNIV